MAQAAQRMTAEEFLALPEASDGPWIELVEGEVIVNDPRWRHNRVQTEILLALGAWTKASPGHGNVGVPLDIQLDERNVYAPDILWYPEGSEPDLDTGPSPLPSLAVEIRSPSTWRYDIGAKKSAYERHGLPELWLVDTLAAEVLVFRRSRPGALAFDVALELGQGDALESPLLPGFELPLAGLFPALPR